MPQRDCRTYNDSPQTNIGMMVTREIANTTSGGSKNIFHSKPMWKAKVITSSQPPDRSLGRLIELYTGVVCDHQSDRHGLLLGLSPERTMTCMAHKKSSLSTALRIFYIYKLDSTRTLLECLRKSMFLQKAFRIISFFNKKRVVTIVLYI
jgi:hypothetical protein